VATGYIYALTSPKTTYVKIGLSERLPPLRLAEINANDYGGFAPWSIHDFIHVKDVAKTETYLHRGLRDVLARDVPGTKELFRITPDQATKLFEDCPRDHFFGDVRLERLRHNIDFSQFLRALLHVSGLDLVMHLQGYWTLSLYPSTNGGRLFTINIGQHEVAFALDPRGRERVEFVLVTDKLAARGIRASTFGALYSKLLYTSASARLRRTSMICSLQEAKLRLHDPVLRRGLVAYWMDHLIRISEEGRPSLHAKHHNSNAVRQVMKHSYCKP